MELKQVVLVIDDFKFNGLYKADYVYLLKDLMEEIIKIEGYAGGIA